MYQEHWVSFSCLGEAGFVLQRFERHSSFVFVVVFGRTGSFGKSDWWPDIVELFDKFEMFAIARKLYNSTADPGTLTECYSFARTHVARQSHLCGRQQSWQQCGLFYGRCFLYFSIQCISIASSTWYPGPMVRSMVCCCIVCLPLASITYLLMIRSMVQAPTYTDTTTTTVHDGMGHPGPNTSS